MNTFLDTTIPDARRRLINWAVGLPLLKASATPSELAKDFQWARATELVDRAIAAWMEDREKFIPRMTDADAPRLLVELHRHVTEFVIQTVEERVKKSKKKARAA